jgi:hypothetical protein
MHRRRVPWVYILRCSDDSLYVGVTADLSTRIEQKSIAVRPPRTQREEVVSGWCTQKSCTPRGRVARHHQAHPRVLRAIAESHGWTLDGIEIRELTPPEDALDLDEQNTMFHPSEIELASTTKRILDDVELLKPTCVVFDSLSELRLLAGTALRYRRQILALKQYFATRDCTVVSTT